MEAGSSQFVEFELCAERFAVPILDVQEIIRMQEITEIPNSSRELEGVINLRGKIVPVVRPGRTLTLRPVPDTAASRIVVVGYGDEAVGLIVDRVHQVRTFSGIQPPPAAEGETEQRWIAGVGQAGERLIGILHVQSVLERRGL